MGPLTADEILSHNPRIEIVTAEYGLLSLQAYVSDEDLNALGSLSRQGLGVREFAVHVMARVIREPHLKVEDIRSWDDGLLTQVALAWADHHEVGWKLGEEGTPLERFRKGFDPLYQRFIEVRKQVLASALKMLPVAFDLKTAFPKITMPLGISTISSSLTADLKMTFPKIAMPPFPIPTIVQDVGSIINGISIKNDIFIKADYILLQGLQQFVLDSTKRVYESFQESFTNILGEFQQWQQMLSVVADSLPKFTLVGFQDKIHTSAVRLLDSLPDLADFLPDLRERLERQQKAIEALDETGFGFVTNYWYPDDLTVAWGMDQVHPHIRHATMTNRLLGLANSTEFQSAMRQDFASSQVLQQRWRVIEKALDAHRQRLYTLSIPVLYAQVEGLFTDALILKGTVLHKDGKLYAKENGQMKLNKKGNPIEIHGLKQVIQNSDLGNSPLLQPMADSLMNSLFADRNDVMHGRKSNYGQARRSLTLVLTASILAALFADLKP